MSVSVIIPVIRPGKAEKCIQLVNLNAGIADYEILAEIDKDRIGCPQMVKELTKKAKYDLVCFLGDDALPQENFLAIAIEYMKQNPDGWGLVGFNDRTGRTLPTHWLAHKKLLPYLDNEFFHTGYVHCFCDNELMDRCIKLGRYIYGVNAIVLHDHPLLKKEELIGDYAEIYDSKRVLHDKLLYLKRKRYNWKGAFA